MGEAPVTPEDPVSIEAYEAVIAAMDRMIAQADGKPVEEACYTEELHPRGRGGGKWVGRIVNEVA